MINVKGVINLKPKYPSEIVDELKMCWQKHFIKVDRKLVEYLQYVHDQ